VPSHTFEDHVGEVRMRVDAPTLASLFEEAARGIADLMLETTSAVDAAGVEAVELHAPDKESLLVDWLNEIIFLSETRRHVYTGARVQRISDTELDAVVHGVVPENLRTPVKAATLHALKIEETPQGYSASVTLDV
jgi:SHS2 domain-containing protein